jgi:hypothetical protein
MQAGATRNGKKIESIKNKWSNAFSPASTDALSRNSEGCTCSLGRYWRRTATAQASQGLCSPLSRAPTHECRTDCSSCICFHEHARFAHGLRCLSCIPSVWWAAPDAPRGLVLLALSTRTPHSLAHKLGQQSSRGKRRTTAGSARWLAVVAACTALTEEFCRGSSRPTHVYAQLNALTGWQPFVGHQQATALEVPTLWGAAPARTRRRPGRPSLDSPRLSFAIHEHICRWRRGACSCVQCCFWHSGHHQRCMQDAPWH